MVGLPQNNKKEVFFMKKKSKLILTLVVCLTLLCSISAPAMAISIDYFYAMPSGDISLGQYKSFHCGVSERDGDFQYRFVAWDGQQVHWLTDWTQCSSNYFSYGFYPDVRGDWEVDVFVQDGNYSLYNDNFFTVY